VRIKDIHNNHRQQVKELYAGQGGCLNIKFTREELNPKHKIKKGLHIARNFKFVRRFKATVRILKHPTSIKKGYEAMLHSESISQNVKFIDLDGRDYLRIGDSCLVTFEFCHHAEFLFVDSRILLRDGNAKAYGNITEIIE
jgi:GTPase